MKYLCLIYVEEDKLDAIPRESLDAVRDECVAQRDEWQKTGQLSAAERLEGVETAVTVRVRDGRMSVTDGPFAETKEQLGGFYLIDARDLNVAIRLASEIPPARLGSIEVRPVRELR